MTWSTDRNVACCQASGDSPVWRLVSILNVLQEWSRMVVKVKDTGHVGRILVNPTGEQLHEY